MEQGIKNDQGKVRLDLYPPEALIGTSEVLTFGALKYAANNFRLGILYSRVFAALLRHLLAWWMGEELDPESGKPHLDHAGCCIAFLQTYIRHPEKYKEFDDRWHKHNG